MDGVARDQRWTSNQGDVGCQGLRIAVVAGAGEGQTTLSAFDAALYSIGVHNHNLLPLSSIIPPGAAVAACDRYAAADHQFGHKLYVVKAEMRSDAPGAIVGAGLGWMQWADGRGCFVEHEAIAHHGSCAELESTLRGQIVSSLQDLSGTRGVPFDPDAANVRVISTRVTSQPACAVVLAVYEAEGWTGPRAGSEASEPEVAPTIWSSSDLPYACLKDMERTLTFQRAIRHVVRPGDVVIDAGAGSGVLSFFAAEAGAAKVFAIEIAPELVSALRLSVALNELDDQIVVVPGDATKVSLPRNVDVVIGELMETGLLDETQVAVVNSLRHRGVIGPRSRLIPDRYTTSIELVSVDDTFYGFKIAAPFHEWPNYREGESGWLPTQIVPLTRRVVVADVDLCRHVEPRVDRSVILTGLADGTANAVRLSGTTRLAPGIVLGQTNALNGDKILRLPELISVGDGASLSCRVSFVMGGGLGTFALRREG